MPDPDMAQYTGVFRAGKPRQVKRNRQPVSCVACQRRKSKCDKRHPCGACDKRGDGDDCRFGAAHRQPGAARQEVQMKLSKLQQMIKGFAGADGSVVADPHDPVSVSRWHRQHAPMTATASAVPPSYQPTPAASSSGPSSYQPTPASSSGIGAAQETSPHSSSSAPSEQTPRLYHGATNWASVVNEIQNIQHLLQTDSDLESNPDLDTADEFDQLLGYTRPISIEEIKLSLPTKLFTDRLISCYFNAKFHAVPFLHAHQFRRQYEAFWEHPDSTAFLWISLLFSVLGAGALLAKAKLTNEPGLLESIEEPVFYLGISARCLIAGNYLACKPGSVEAMLQHAHSRNMQRQDEDRVLWALYALAVRMAQKQGYHRDPSQLPNHFTPFESEMRRRTWFMIQSADLLVALHSGLPPIVHESLTDTEHPINLLDEDFDEDTAELPPPRPPTDPTPILAYIAKSKISFLLRRVMVHVLAVNRPTYEETLRLSDELEAWHNAQPACLRIRSIRSTSFTDANYTIMHRIMLELMYRKCLCVLHRPYLTEHKGDPRYDRSRKICREAALAMLQMHIELDEEIGVQGRMYEDRFMVSNLTLQHFLIASTVVCVDLSESHDMPPEERQICKSILQQSHDVWAARSAYSSDARHATKILRVVLNKVDNPGAMSSYSPGYDRGATVMSSSAGMSPAMADAGMAGLEPPFTAMNIDMKTPPPPPPPQPLGSVTMPHMATAIPMLDANTGQPHPHHQQQQQQQQQHSHLHSKLSLSQPLLPHHHHAVEQGGVYPYDPAAAGYVVVPDATTQFIAPFEAVSDLDALLYSTEGVNWNSIDQFLRVGNHNDDPGWCHVLHGV